VVTARRVLVTTHLLRIDARTLGWRVVANQAGDEKRGSMPSSGRPSRGLLVTEPVPVSSEHVASRSSEALTHRGVDMNQRWAVVRAATVLAVLFAGCRAVVPQEALPVGTCVLVHDQGTTVVPCSEPHSHKVIAIAPRAEACPTGTDMYSQPADPDDGLTTTCFQSHTATD
jgi:hypothetical protein